jgi:hypothetical protein
LSILGGVLDFLGDIGSFFKSLLGLIWVGFLLPASLMLAIAYGGWLYFGPLMAANILIAYKLNKARRAERTEAFDDKRFGSAAQALESYVKILKRARQSRNDSED